MRLSEHVFDETGECLHCNWSPAAGVDKNQRSCVFRDTPDRPTPPSIFADLGAIGERLKEIQAAEGALA